MENLLLSDFERRVGFIKELKACCNFKDLKRGKAVHEAAKRVGDDFHVYVASTLINMYAKCGCMRHAREAFDAVDSPNVVCWNALIFGYADNGEAETALELFSRMGRESCAPDAVTFVAALKASAVKEDGKRSFRVASKQRGGKLHLLALAMGFDSDAHVQGVLVDMYAKCGKMELGRGVFDNMKHQDVVAWTALILGYADNGEGETALKMFSQMRREGCPPDVRTFVAALKACTDLALRGNGKVASKEKGKKLHLLALARGWDSNIFVQGTLVDMYAKCGSMGNARKVFDSMKEPDVVAWTALILGYADNDKCETALDMFLEMRSLCCSPNAFTFSAVFKACSILGALELGKKFHAEFKCSGLKSNAVLANALLDLYAKCGSLYEAEEIFEAHVSRNLVTWTTLITGYSSNGDTESAFSVFNRMIETGLQPDGVTFYCILTACSHSGLVEKGLEYFRTMSRKYGVNPRVEHYNCLIDLLGRANMLDEAMSLSTTMTKHDSVTWLTVLASCRRWKNVRLGRLAFEALTSLDGERTGAYVLMSNMCGNSDQARLQAVKTKFSGQERSWWTTADGIVHTFVVLALR